jgi:poly-gamma-glutamate biosynthesis protein PgsC/CapC
MGYEMSFLGLVISLVFIGLTGYFPGGIIVPGYLALFLDHPTRILGTLAVALVSFLCYRLIAHYLILFGNRRFVCMILLGGCFTFLSLRVLPQIFPASPEFQIIGWVVPGLIANQFERQGVMVTTGALLAVTALIYMLGKAVHFVL